ncbi:MAG TPA: DinB family protein [Longimicrobiales bacterium]|nr:DinB family protein [Longimicrobiales bacterium]
MAKRGGGTALDAAASAPDRRTIEWYLREAYAGPAWHGPSVRAALSGVTAEAAAWRPGPGRNTIWELALHLACTRHRLLLRAGDDAAGRFPRRLTRSWWPSMPERATAGAWREDRALLEEYQERLLDVVAGAPAERLLTRRPGQRGTIAHELLGVALHDTYHAGQIRLLARLREGAAVVAGG